MLSNFPAECRFREAGGSGSSRANGDTSHQNAAANRPGVLSAALTNHRLADTLTEPQYVVLASSNGLIELFSLVPLLPFLPSRRPGMALAMELRGEVSHTTCPPSGITKLLEIMPDTNPQTMRSSRGFSLLEALIVVTIGLLLTAIAVPQMVRQRRLLRSTAVNREISAQLRFARQLAMSQRQSVTFQYDDAATKKQITIINHNNNQSLTPSCNLSKTAIFAATGFPNTICSTVVTTYPLTQGGLPAAEITYGIPAGSQLPTGAPVIPVTKLDDNIVMTPLTPVGAGGKLNITFQPDGSVIDAAGFPLDRAMYFFNNVAAQSTASAISVVGASGRVKVWRYNLSGNNYVE